MINRQRKGRQTCWWSWKRFNRKGNDIDDSVAENEKYWKFISHVSALTLNDSQWMVRTALLEWQTWIKLLYTNPQAHLLINGNVQPHPTRGVEQGDPLSALLFAQTIKLLEDMLRAHKEHGVCSNAEHTLMSVFFADESTLLANLIVNLRSSLRS